MVLGLPYNSSYRYLYVNLPVSQCVSFCQKYCRQFNSVYPLWTIPQISIIRLQYLVCSIRAAIGISIIITCVYPFVRDKVRLELGGESTLVTQVRTVTAVGHYVLLHRVLGGERTLTNVTLKRSKSYTYEMIKINNS